MGTVGSSYDGWTQWELAHAKPPHLAAMMPQAIAASTLDQEMSGVLRLGQSLQWMIVNLAPDQIARDDEPWGPRDWDESKRLFNERDRDKWTWFLPLMEIPDHAMHGLGHHWRKWLGERGRDNFDFLTKLRNIEAPAFITTSWFDQQVNALKLFSGMSENAASETARTQTRIMVGPWRHTGTDFERTVGKVDFGPEAERDFYQVVEQWFGYWLKGEDTGLDYVPRAQLFVMGANRWRHEEKWPLPNTRYTDYFFHSNGNAKTIAGDGLLSREPPGESPPNEYVYDPRDPVMTIYPASAGSHEPADERPLDGRQDVLVFQTPPLAEDVEVVGRHRRQALGRILSARHGLYRQARRCLARWLLDEALLRHRPRTLPGVLREPDADRAGAGLRVHHPDEPYRQPVQARPPDTRRHIEQ